jgi:hypothetical protein
MTQTPDLIEQLVSQGSPVRRLPSPIRRAGCWLVLAVAVIGGLGLLHGGLRPDISVRIADPWFSAGLLASAATGVLATLAAFLSSLPDRSRCWLLLPVPAALVWLATVGVGCLTNWVTIGPDGIQWGSAAACFATLLAAAVPLSAAMLWMLRHAARLRPTGTILAGALAVAALTATALSLLHVFEASAMILLWNFGTAALVLLADAVMGRRILRLAR